ncbi:MAG: flagellar hook-basal body complex protein FliE [Alphaproteobacteria bacterium]|nr:flagellar hook-basal body complex protein FliE [Alphaproteobacteria bacterium]
MVNEVSKALSAYQAAAARQVIPSAAEPTVSPEGTFSSLLRSAAVQAEEDNKQAELLSIKAVKGTADMQDVVMAVSNAEVALQTVVAVRDKVVSAYQEIMQMPI